MLQILYIAFFSVVIFFGQVFGNSNRVKKYIPYPSSKNATTNPQIQANISSKKDSAQLVAASISLAAESRKYCLSTAINKANPKMIVDQVNRACTVVEEEGDKAYPLFKGKGSEFIFAGTYLWICDLNGKILLHPFNPNLENRILIGLKDYNGKKFIVEMIDMAIERNYGWVDYSWSEPNSIEQTLKLVYLKKSICNGIPVLICCTVDDKAIK